MTTTFRGLEGFEAWAKNLSFEVKAKDFKMSPRGRGRHLCHLVVQDMTVID